MFDNEKKEKKKKRIRYKEKPLIPPLKYDGTFVFVLVISKDASRDSVNGSLTRAQSSILIELEFDRRSREEQFRSTHVHPSLT